MKAFSLCGDELRKAIRFFGVVPVLVLLSACGGGGAADGVVAPPSGQLASLTLSPDIATIAVGGAITLTATARDDLGQPLAGAPTATFTSSAPTIASVSLSGSVTGVATGSATITASMTIGAITKTATAAITVSAAPPSGGATVTTPGTTFSPSTVTITAGAAVTWSFSGAIHNVTFNGAAPPGGNILDQSVGASVSRTFPQAGTFAYECTRHIGMRGTVIVQGASAAVFTSVSLTPSTPSVDVGGTVLLSALAMDQDGNTIVGAPPPNFATSNATTATVANDGMVTGVGVGSAVISATIAIAGVSKSAQATVTVTPSTPPPGTTIVTTSGTAFAPPSVTIPVGGTVSWRFSGAVHNVTFAEAAPTGGNIPDQPPGNAVSRAFPVAGTYDYDCTRHTGMAGRVIVQSAAPAVYTSLAIAPATPSIDIGGIVTLAATPLDQDGSPMAGLPQPAFSSADLTRATVSAAGAVTGLAAGTVTITASLTNGVTTHTAAATVTVRAPSAGPIVTTPNRTFAPASVTVPPNTQVTWQFSEARHNVTFVAAAPPGGSVPDQQPGNAVSRTFVTPGSYAYECTVHPGMDGAIVVSGSAPPVFSTLDLTPTTPQIPVGATVQLIAVARDQNGAPLASAPPPVLTSSAGTIASVTAGGLVTGMAPGVATVTASLTISGVTKSAVSAVTVAAAPPPGGAPLTVTTPNRTFAPPSLTVNQGETVTWQFSESRHNVTFLGPLPPGGHIPDQQPGNAVTRIFSAAGTFDYECTIHSGMTGTIVVRGAAAPVLTSLSVAPNAPTITVGGTVQLVATPLDQNGTAMPGLPAATFGAANASIASVNAAGMITGVAPGTTTVTASLTSGAVTKTAAAVVTVQPASPPGGGNAVVTTPNRTFSPASVTIPAGGMVTWQFSGATHNVTFLGVLPPGGNIPDQAVGNAASRTFPTAGSFAYECTRHGGMVGTVVVQAPSTGGTYTSLRLAANSPSIGVGQSTQVVATPLDQNGAPMAGAPAATFTSSATGVATVSATGSVTGVGAGTATITASLTWNGVTKTATVGIAVTAQPTGVVISTAGQVFTPDDVDIAPGQSVTWDFVQATSNVTFKTDAPPGGNIPDTAPGNRVTRVFPAIGTYDYECTIHKGMKGRVRVR